MAGTHRRPSPSPYTIAAGAVAYSLAATFHKNLPIELVAALPAAVAVGVNALERAIAVIDPAFEAEVAPVVEDAAKAIDAAVAVVSAGVADAPAIEAKVEPLVG